MIHSGSYNTYTSHTHWYSWVCRTDLTTRAYCMWTAVTFRSKQCICVLCVSTCGSIVWHCMISSNVPNCIPSWRYMRCDREEWERIFVLFMYVCIVCMYVCVILAWPCVGSSRNWHRYSYSSSFSCDLTDTTISWCIYIYIDRWASVKYGMTVQLHILWWIRCSCASVWFQLKL